MGVDAKDGFVATDGWLNVSRTQGVDFCRRVYEAGVRNVIYTDIARDGAMQGTNLSVYETLAREVPGLGVTASGGISSLSEIRALAAMGTKAAIVGKAVYTGALALPDVLAAAGRNSSMVTKRIIPCLDIRNGRVVKGVNFKGVQDVEDPVALARRYNDAGADELVFYDITASVEGRGLFTDVLRDVARQIFIPSPWAGQSIRWRISTGCSRRARTR